MYLKYNLVKRNDNLKSSKLTVLIFLALILGIIAGVFFPGFAVKTQPIATLFLNMVKMIIAPLLFSTLVVGIAGHSDIKSLGKIGLKTIIYFEIVTTLALVIGLFAAHVFQPGKGFEISASSSQMAMATSMATTKLHNSLSDIVVDIVPTSIVKAMAEGDLLQIVVFALFFAIAICIVGKKAKPVMDVLNATADIMFKFTELVMWFAPLGVFAAIASNVGMNGLSIIGSYAKVIFALYVALAFFVLLVLVVACKIVKISFRNLFQAIKDPALLAFTTASSEAALPKAMEVMEKFGVPKNIVGFVLPAGYTFNLDGSTLYLALAVIFSTQILGIDLSVKQQILIMLTLMLTSKGVAGVPRVSLVVLAGTLSGFGYPLVGVAILLGIDHFLDMGRATVNLIGNCVATIVIARWENKFDYKQMDYFLTNKCEISRRHQSDI